jgi:hypothetical protein
MRQSTQPTRRTRELLQALLEMAALGALVVTVACLPARPAEEKAADARATTRQLSPYRSTAIGDMQGAKLFRPWAQTPATAERPM